VCVCVCVCARACVYVCAYVCDCAREGEGQAVWMLAMEVAPTYTCFKNNEVLKLVYICECMSKCVRRMDALNTCPLKPV